MSALDDGYKSGPELVTTDLGDEASDESYTARPNRWTGPASTYLGLIEREKNLAERLTHEQSLDLSAHLYNAAALRRRAATNSAWSPPRGWTAWPMNADEVPRPDEGLRPDSDPDVIFSERYETMTAGELLMEHVSVVLAKAARSKLTSRASRQTRDDFNREAKTTSQVEEKPAGLRASMSTDLAENKQMSNVLLSSGTPPMPPATIIDQESALVDSGSHSSERFADIMMSSDDEEIADALKPAAQHIITQLATLIAQLSDHHAADASEHSETNTELDAKSEHDITNAAAESQHIPARRKTSRPASPTFSPRKRRPGRPAEVITEGGGNVILRKQKVRGRRQMQYPRLEDETEEAFTLRIARLQKKALPVVRSSAKSQSPAQFQSFSALANQSRLNRKRLRSSTRSRSRSRQRAGDETETADDAARDVSERPPNRKRRVGRKDWQVVLKAAVQVGLPSSAIERTKKRCEHLFESGQGNPSPAD